MEIITARAISDTRSFRSDAFVEEDFSSYWSFDDGYMVMESALWKWSSSNLAYSLVEFTALMLIYLQSQLL